MESRERSAGGRRRPWMTFWTRLGAWLVRRATRTRSPLCRRLRRWTSPEGVDRPAWFRHSRVRMKKIGLALSGGGFRASLYHLGLVRFLRDAGILPQVSHITSVSGGSIFAAHLVLNWDRYNGSAKRVRCRGGRDCSTFVRLDVRNRITRRFPLAFALRWPRRLLGCSNRKLTLHGAAGIPLREISLRRHQLVPVAGKPATAHPGHQPERRVPVLLQPRRAVDDAAATGTARFASTASTSAWPPCRWPSPPRRRSPASSRRWS